MEIFSIATTQKSTDNTADDKRESQLGGQKNIVVGIIIPIV
jgi:hypothetical protein